MWHETQIRVRYAETDKMGIVHHSNYFVWFELGRSEFCRSRGFSYREMEEEDNALLVVAESYCRYKAPAYYEDLLTVRTQIARIRSRSIVFVYQIFRHADQVTIAQGETLHMVVDRNSKVRSLPERYKRLLQSGGTDRKAIPADRAPS